MGLILTSNLTYPSPTGMTRKELPRGGLQCTPGRQAFSPPTRGSRGEVKGETKVSHVHFRSSAPRHKLGGRCTLGRIPLWRRVIGGDKC